MNKCDSSWQGEMIHLLRHALHQLSMYLLKARPLLGIPPPAAQHQIIVDSVRTSVGLWQVHLGARDTTSMQDSSERAMAGVFNL